MWWCVVFCPALMIIMHFLLLLLLQEEDDDTSVKIAHFGFAKKVTGENCLKTLCETAHRYVAPEIIDLKCDGYDQRSDVWSSSGIE